MGEDIGVQDRRAPARAPEALPDSPNPIEIAMAGDLTGAARRFAEAHGAAVRRLPARRAA